MSDTLRKVDYFYTDIPNTPGQGAKIMAGLAAAGVNLLAFSGFPNGRRAQLDLMPADSAKLAPPKRWVSSCRQGRRDSSSRATIASAR
jgi:hypothetical protein